MIASVVTAPPIFRPTGGVVSYNSRGTPACLRHPSLLASAARPRSPRETPILHSARFLLRDIRR